MTNEIEGKPVSPELMKGITDPHIVPVELWGDINGYHGGLTNLKGHVEGYIPKSDAEFLPERIRRLVRTIIDSGIGEKSRHHTDDELRLQFINAFGGKLILCEGMREGPDILLGEQRIKFEDQRQGGGFKNLHIAARGYVFSPAKRGEPVRTMREPSLLLDTSGDWLEKGLQNSRGAEKETHMIVTARSDEGNISLAQLGTADKPEPLIIEGATYRGDFLPVAKLSDVEYVARTCSQQLVVALYIHNVLTAVQKVCSAEER